MIVDRARPIDGSRPRLFPEATTVDIVCSVRSEQHRRLVELHSEPARVLVDLALEAKGSSCAFKTPQLYPISSIMLQKHGAVSLMNLIICWIIDINMQDAQPRVEWIFSCLLRSLALVKALPHSEQ